MYRRTFTSFFHPSPIAATAASSSCSLPTLRCCGNNASIRRSLTGNNFFSPIMTTSCTSSISALYSSFRHHSMADAGTPYPWIDGEVRPEYTSKHDRKKLNPATMPHFVQAKIQNDRRDMGLSEITDWNQFAEGAVYIPTTSGPIWAGVDDPRAAQFVRRKSKYKENPMQISRKKPGEDAALKLEDHPLRPYFSEPCDINDPMSVADGLYKAGMIKSYDVKYTSSRIEYKPRPPIVTVMGHVDHGKTSLLDYLRKSNVAAGEAGGITQSVGAFCVQCGPEPAADDTTSFNENRICFIDTPGHQAFTEMRKVGAGCTDVIVLVISTIDGVQPQTLEVVDIAREAKIPLVVAANKIDRSRDVEAIRKALKEKDVVLDEDGGDVQLVRVSALTGEGVPELLEAIQLQAAMSELVTPSPSRAEIHVIESRSPDATEVVGVVKCGVVKPGMTFASGVCYAVATKVVDEHGRDINPRKGAGPSTAVILSGFKLLPKPGSTLFQLSSALHGERYYELMRDVYKMEGGREAYLQKLARESRGQIYQRKPNNDTYRAFDSIVFNLYLFAATSGQLQALLSLLYALPNIDGVQVQMKGAEIGGPDNTTVTVMMGTQQPGAVLIFGKVQAKNHLDFPSRIDVFQFDVVYHGVEWLKRRIVSALPKKQCERVVATALCKQVFRASQAPDGGNAAGLFVQKGTLTDSNPVAVLRAAKKGEEAVKVHTGKIKELRRFKEIVPSVDQQLECGLICYEPFAFRVGDIVQSIESYEEELDVEKVYDAAEEKERINRNQAMIVEQAEQEKLDSKMGEFMQAKPSM